MGRKQMPCYVPPEIVTTSRRPDITIYLPPEKQGIIIDFMVPAEENLAQANFREKKWSMKIWSWKDKVQDGSQNISL